jgi:hypothetical protein
MAYVRRHPEAAGQPKQYFNIQENEYLQCLNDWETENAGQSLAAACRWLERCGAVRITPLAS